MKPQNINVKSQGKMTVLNWKNVHFNLIVGPLHMLSQAGSIRFQQSQVAEINSGLLQSNPIPPKDYEDIPQAPKKVVASNVKFAANEILHGDEGHEACK